MKSKKKFLLLGVGVMGALALGVGATSTFAWYQSSASASKVDGTKHAENVITAVSLGAQSYDLSVTIELEAVNTNGGAEDSLQLAHYDTSATAYKHYYATDSSASNLIEYGGESGCLDSKAYKVNVTADSYSSGGVVLSQQQVANMIAAVGFTVTVSVPEKWDYTSHEGGSSAPTNAMASRTIVWASGNAIADNAAPVTSSGSKTFDILTSNAFFTSWTGAKKTAGYIAISVEGNNGSAVDTTDLNVAAVVTITKKS